MTPRVTDIGNCNGFMATTRQLTDLFRALALDDLRSARIIADGICRSSEEAGHRSAARALRGALSAQRNGRRSPAGVGAQVASIASSALVQLRSDKTLNDVTLASNIRAQLTEVVSEYEAKDVLETHGLPRRTKLILHGPPGSGKSLTALALANALGLPVFMVRFDALIGAFLGQTAGHLRQVFQFAEVTPCVLLLDEIDALGKQRGNPLDVGELDRIVIALMQELEHSVPKGLIVATSNLARHLDDALWRRFDLVLRFKKPTTAQLRNFVIRKTADLGIKPSAALIRSAAKGSYAAAEQVLLAAARRRLLQSHQES